MTANKTVPSADNYIVEESEFSVDERPAQATSTSSVVASGWDAADLATPQQSEGFPTEYKHSEQPQVVKFLDQNGPFAVFKLHFLAGKPGKKSYICLNTNGQTNCPLCSVLHHKPEDKKAFSVVNFSAEGGPQRQILVATPRFYKNLHLAHFSPQGPLTKNYWSISRTGKMQTTVYHMQAIKARDLSEDWAPLNETDCEAFVATATPFEASLYRETPYAELLEIAQEQLGS